MSIISQLKKKGTEQTKSYAIYKKVMGVLVERKGGR